MIYAGPIALLVVTLPFLASQELRSSGLILFPLAVLILICTMIYRKTAEFAVTDRRVIIKTGLIARKTLETQLSKLEGVGVDQSIAGRAFRYGNITVKGTGGTSKPFKLINNPMRFRKAVQEIASHYAATTQSPTSQPRPDDVVDKLERLGTLHEKGVLSDDEFAQQKAQLLTTAQ
jgi:uncharacterized membrane protein YdbT with pleckstrin-like domain